MLSWTGFGWIGIVFFMAAIGFQTIASKKIPDYRLAVFFTTCAIMFLACFVSGSLLRRYFPLPLHRTAYGKETVSHECCTVELEWAGLFAIPFFAIIAL